MIRCLTNGLGCAEVVETVKSSTPRTNYTKRSSCFSPPHFVLPHSPGCAAAVSAVSLYALAQGLHQVNDIAGPFRSGGHLDSVSFRLALHEFAQRVFVLVVPPALNADRKLPACRSSRLPNTLGASKRGLGTRYSLSPQLSSGVRGIATASG